MAFAIIIVVVMVVAFVIVVVLMLMVVVMPAAAAVVMVVIMVMVVMVVLVIMVMVMVVMVVPVLVIVVVIMVVSAAAFDLLVQLVVQAGVVHGVVHPVLELVLVHIEDGAHEVEVDLLAGLEGAVVLDAVLHVGEVQGDALALVVDDGGLDVAQEASGLVGDPLADLEQGLGEPGLRIGVEACDGPFQSDSASAGLLDGGRLMLMVVIVVVLVLAHLIIS